MSDNLGMGPILVIKHGALGDFILSTGPFKTIRMHHTEQKIVLLTTLDFANLGKMCGWFDSILIDSRPKPWNISGLIKLRSNLLKDNYSRVYDLQTSKRSSSYFSLFKNPKPEWSGIVRAASHPHINPNRDKMHTIERQAEQLKLVGITQVFAPDISWLEPLKKKFEIPSKFFLLVSGGSVHRKEKRWPPEKYAEFANILLGEGITPVLIGSQSEYNITKLISSACPDALNLCGKTEIADIASLARNAIGAVGNDTGPMHIIASSGCPSLVLFSKDSDPSITLPRGPKVKFLKEDNLKFLEVCKVRREILLR